MPALQALLTLTGPKGTINRTYIEIWVTQSHLRYTPHFSKWCKILKIMWWHVACGHGNTMFIFSCIAWIALLSHRAGRYTIAHSYPFSQTPIPLSVRHPFTYLVIRSLGHFIVTRTYMTCIVTWSRQCAHCAGHSGLLVSRYHNVLETRATPKRKDHDQKNYIWAFPEYFCHWSLMVTQWNLGFLPPVGNSANSHASSNGNVFQYIHYTFIL